MCGCNFVPELIRNPACEETRDVNYTVFQLSKPYTLVESGNLYAIETKSLEQNIGELYDDKRFSTRGASSINYSTEQKRNMTCAVSDGTYTYTTALGTEITNTLSPTKNDMWFFTGDKELEHILWQV